MAVVSRISTLRLDDTATHTTNALQFVSTAAVEQTAEGGSVVITTVRTVVGAVPPGNPDTLTLSIYNDAGALVVAFTLNTTSASQTSTYFFTDTGATGGASRHGTLEIAIRATRTSIGTYDVETDASPNTAPTGFDSHLDRGYIIGTTTKVHAFSDVALGGAKNQPAEYDESLFLRVTLGSLSYNARALAVVLSAGSLSGNTNSTTAVNRDITFANTADDRFPAAVTTVSATVTAPNATLTALPYTVFTATTADTINVDPRLTASHHFQVDDNTFAVSKHRASKSMLSTESGFLATRYVTARTLAGVNGLTVNQTLTPVGPGTTVGPTASTTATRDSLAGWTDLLAWTSSKPGGTWNKTTAITAPTDIDGAGMVLAPTDAYVLLAPNPNYRVVVGGGPAGGEDNHLSPGSTLLIGMVMLDTSTRKLLTPDASPAPAIFVTRFNQALGRPEYLTAAFTWASAGAGATIDAHALTVSAGDAQTFIKTLAMTTGVWTTSDLFFVGIAYIGGTPYTSPGATPVLSAAANLHGSYVLDPVALALTGGLTFR